MSVPNIEGYICKDCTKIYKSKQSLWNHRSKYHNINLANNPPKSINNLLSPANNPPKFDNNILTNNSKYICQYCNYKFTRSDSLKKHFDRCKVKNKNIITNENEMLKKQIDDLTYMVKQLLIHNKVHPKTLQKINKNLTNNTNNGNINNGTINNTYNIIKFGNENINELLTDKEKFKILNMKYKSIEESIKTIHFNENRPECQNILISNLRDDIAHVFNG